MADITMSVGFAFNKQDLNKATEELEKQFSDLSINPEIAKNLKNELSSARGMISGFQRDIIRELSKIDLSSATVGDYEKIVNAKLNEMNAPIVALANRIHELDNSFDPKPFLDYFNTFKKSAMDFSKSIFQVSQAAEKAGYTLKLEGNPAEQIDSIVDSLERMAKEISSLNLNKFEKQFVSTIKDADEAKTEYDELCNTFVVLNDEYGRLYNARRRLEDINASDNEKLAVEYQINSIMKQRLETALKIQALEWSDYDIGDSYFQKGVKGFKDYDTIIKHVTESAENLTERNLNLAGSYKTLKKGLEEGIGISLLSDSDAKRIANEGVIKVDTKIQITTSPEEIWDSIKDKLQEVQKIADAAGATTVPIKIEGVDKEAQQVIQDIIDEFEKPENKIPVHLELSTQEIDKLNDQLKQEELEGHIDFGEMLDEASKKAEALKKAFEEINNELLEAAQKREEAFQFDESKYSEDSLAEQVRQAQNRADNAITDLRNYFKENPIYVEFDIDQAVTNLEVALDKEHLTGKIDLTENLQKAGDMVDELVTHLRSIEDIDFKSKFINSIDLANAISQIDQMATALAGIEFQMKEMQQIDLTAMPQEMKLDFGEALPLFEKLVDAVEQLHQVLSNTVATSPFDSLKRDLESISQKIGRIKSNITAIKIDDKVVKAFQNLNTAITTLIGFNTGALNEVSDALERMDKIDADTIARNLSSLKVITKANVTNINNIAPALEKLREELVELDKTEFSGFLYQIEHILQNAEALKSLATVTSNTRKQLDSFSRSLSGVGKDITAPVEKIETALQGLGREANIDKFMPEYADNVERLYSLIDQFNRRKNQPSLFQKEEMEKLKQEIIEVNFQLQETDKIVQSPAKTNAIKKLNKFLRDSSKLTEEEREQIDLLIKRINNPNLSMTEFREIMASFNQIEAGAIKAGRATSSFFDAIRNKLKYGWAQTFATFFSFYDIIRYMREVSSTVAELNSKLIELAKVSEASVGELYKDFNDFAAIAKETGGTISDIIGMTSDWARNGFNLPQSKELARVSSIFQNIGDGITAAQSNEYLVSTIKGFRLQAEDAIDIIDKINNVSNNAASGVSDIGEALERSSSALGAANTDLSKSIALLTTAKQHWLYVQKCA